MTTLHDFGGVLDGLWTLSFGLSQFHGHGSWLVCEVALNVGSTIDRTSNIVQVIMRAGLGFFYNITDIHTHVELNSNSLNGGDHLLTL